MNIEEIDIKDIEFGEPIEEKENIIKEVREYIESNLINHCNNDFLNDIKKILDRSEINGNCCKRR